MLIITAVSVCECECEFGGLVFWSRALVKTKWWHTVRVTAWFKTTVLQPQVSHLLTQVCTKSGLGTHVALEDYFGRPTTRRGKMVIVFIPIFLLDFVAMFKLQLSSIWTIFMSVFLSWVSFITYLQQDLFIVLSLPPSKSCYISK